MSGVRLAIKVDVDTWRGAREGVPRLLHIFESRGVRASFFLSLGPDNSGRAIWRIFTRPGFLAKQLRTGAPSAFGFRTLLYGTLLPAPIIGTGLNDMVRDLLAAGQEVGLHAWDHVAWHDRLWRMSPDDVEAEVHRGIQAFAAVAGNPPEGFAAPAWRINAAAAAALEKAGVVYLSATRGRNPYRPILDGRMSNLLEIPTTLPTADEVLGRDGVTVDNLVEFFVPKILAPGFHVLTIHAEMEGGGLAPSFEKILDRCLAEGVTVVRLIDAAREILAGPEDVPAAEVVRLTIPGRPGKVSHQRL